MQSKPILEMDGISKSFPGVKVFDNLCFDVREGEVHCICGENGAGKSTLIKILSGAHMPDSGTIRIDGRTVENNTPHLAMELGVQTIYQEHNLFPLLSVYENLFAGNEYTKGGLLRKSQMVNKTAEILEFLNSTISPYDIVGQLGSGEQKTVEVARAFIKESKVIILDEPTASFSQTEIRNLLHIVKKLASEGISIIYISHHLEEVFEIADRVTVIRDGMKINTYNIKDLDECTLINDMVGRDVCSFFNREKVDIGSIKFEAENFSGNGVSNISFAVREGELVGFSGMVGSGRSELAELLFGVKKADTGSIKIDGKEVQIHSPIDAILNGMCFITEDRQSTGLSLQHSILSNSNIAMYSKNNKHFVMPSEDLEVAQKYCKSMNVVSPTVHQKVNLLSGGNQQKVVLAKWFATNGNIFIFDEPTRGIDIGAKEEIYKIMTQLLKEGKSIIMISSDMPELIAMSDRVLVMRKGRMVADIPKNEMTEENILKYSIGGGSDD